VTEAVKPFEERIKTLETAKADLERKNSELEQEITNKLGGASNPPKETESAAPRVTGSWN
jgi:chaperonin cofactor prefoldin